MHGWRRIALSAIATGLGCDALFGLDRVSAPTDQALADQPTFCDADLASTDEHCGGCNNACPAAHSCQASQCVPQSCAAILAAAPTSVDGPFEIDTDGREPGAALTVFCDMSTDGGGWTLLFALAPSTPTNNFTTPASWPDTLPLAKTPPAVTGIFKGSLAPFREIREEIASGAVIVYGRDKTVAELDLIRQLYGTQSRVNAAPNLNNIPSCRTSYAAATDSIVGCTMYTGLNGSDTLGWSRDVILPSCWFARGNCCSTAGGSSQCSGDANGTQWARTWLR